jgi:hypothetical protein
MCEGLLVLDVLLDSLFEMQVRQITAPWRASRTSHFCAFATI